MEEPGEAFSIRTPAEVGGRVERSCGRVLEARRPANGDQSAEHASDRLFLIGQRRFALPTPHLLIRIREQRVDDFAKARAGVHAVFVGELFRPDFNVWHGSPPGGHYTAATTL